jgi:hypothetical protein
MIFQFYKNKFAQKIQNLKIFRHSFVSERFFSARRGARLTP